MKKNLIYTVTFLLCGAVFFSSCEDMLNVESNRVEYEFDDWTLNDSVYSVLGILKCVQEVGDRQVLINELRADLLSINEAKAVIDVQELSKSEFNVETNEYLDVKDYYAIINNCNVYLARVDTTLEKNNVKLMMPEYVAVKSVRAWTYLQLVINYGQVPYFTEPILTHSAAEKVMNAPLLSREEILTNLINEMLPYENPSAFKMPAWDSDGKYLKFGYGSNGTEVETEKLFVPVRMLLGDLYLWRGAKGDYKQAAQCYYDIITGARTNSTAPKFVDYSNVSSYSSEGGKNIGTGFGMMFAIKNFSLNSKNILTLIPYAAGADKGTTSRLADVFLPVGDIGGSQVTASPGMISLSERQVYRYAEGDDLDKPKLYEYSHLKNYKTKGDLRLVSSTCKQLGDDDAKTEYLNLVAKFNMETNSTNSEYVPSIPVPYIVLHRPEQAYLRFAEALMGMEREGYEGAMDLAMTVLKIGTKKLYTLLLAPQYDERFVTNAKGDTIKIYNIDPVTKDTLGSEYKKEKYLASYTDSLSYDFTDEAFKHNTGIHSRGCGDSERNIYFALDTINVARYFGYTQKVGEEEVVTKQLTDEDFQLYMSEIILDEMALEFAWEGTRFGDLQRVATALGDKEVLAKRIAGRAFKNTVSHRHPEFQYDAALYTKMIDENMWYLPLPGEFVEPGKVEVTPEDFNPSEEVE